MTTDHPRGPINQEQRMFLTAAVVGGTFLAVGVVGLVVEYNNSPQEGECTLRAFYTVHDGAAQKVYSDIEPQFSMDVINQTGEGAVVVANPEGEGGPTDMTSLKVGQPEDFEIMFAGQALRETLTAVLGEDGSVTVKREQCDR